MVAHLLLHDNFFKALNVFSFSDAIRNDDRFGTFESAKIVIDRFGDFDEEAVKKKWINISDEKTEQQKQGWKKFNLDKTWNAIFSDVDIKEKYPCLFELTNLVRTLPHSNADSERAFSFLVDSSKKNKGHLFTESRKSQVILKYNMKNREEKPEDMEVTDDMLTLFNSSIYKLYQAAKDKHQRMTLYSGKDDDQCNESCVEDGATGGDENDYL